MDQSSLSVYSVQRSMKSRNARTVTVDCTDVWQTNPISSARVTKGKVVKVRLASQE